MPMEVDTAAEVSLIAKKMRERLLPKVQLTKCNIILRTYSEQKLPVLGEISVQIYYQVQLR